MFEKDRKSKNKIKKETHIYWHQLNTQLKWGDIKHLQLEDDDLIYSAYEENEDNGGIFVETSGKKGFWYTSWAKKASSITCEEIGTANENQKKGIILSSFNAG